jgi:small-conductance mechanosensitive channel
MQADQIIERSAYTIAAEFVALLPRLGIALGLLALTWLAVALANRAMHRVLGRTRVRRALAELVVEIADVAFWVVALFVAAAVAFPSVTPANIITGLGLGSVAIGFAFRDIFENFLAGVLILDREPFRLGDCIECAKVEGFVEEITARDTHLRQTDGQRVVLPNALLFKNQVWVRTDREIRRTTVFCRVGFDADLAAAREVIRRAVAPLATVSREQEVQVFAHAFTEDGVEFEVTWWTGSRPVDVRRSRDEVVAAVKRALDEAGLRVAVPRRVLAFDPPLGIGSSFGGDAAAGNVEGVGRPSSRGSGPNRPRGSAQAAARRPAPGHERAPDRG